MGLKEGVRNSKLLTSPNPSKGGECVGRIGLFGYERRCKNQVLETEPTLLIDYKSKQ